MEQRLRLSFLDQSLIPKGGTASKALQDTVTLARLAEKWGYHRFWVSEHHNLKSIAGTAPEILMARLASETSTLRIGSGGIMLPNHSALKVAENFRLLEALFPNRIDLGIGRAPGGDRVTAAFLNPSNNFSEQSYLQQLDHLQIFFKDEGGTEYGRMIAAPQIPTTPQQWMLSSSGGSARIAAKYGMGLAIARFINGQAAPEIAQTYRRSFIPSSEFPEPKVALSLVVLCAETEQRANDLRKAVDYQFLQIEKRIFEGIQTPEALNEYVFSSFEKEILQTHEGKVIHGTPAAVKEKLLRLATAFGAEEVMVVVWAAHTEDRIKTMELLAKEFELDRRTH